MVDAVGDRGTAYVSLILVAVAVLSPEDLYESVYGSCFHYLPPKPSFLYQSATAKQYI